MTENADVIFVGNKPPMSYVLARMPSKVSQNPDDKIRRTAAIRSKGWMQAKAYINPVSMASKNPIIDTLFGVRPIRCAILASEDNISWTLFFNFVSI